MNAPQIIIIVLLAYNVGSSVAKHGKPQDDYNGWVSLISAIITASLLWWGGFFG